ncbi:MAG: polyribonucleotide nucleotidyltransferase [bacterium]
MESSKKKIVKKTMELGGRTLTLETGKLAPQANMAVRVQYDDTVVLATAVANEPRADSDFFPLRIDYEEKLYAGGFIKSSRFMKREGRPRDEATISARLIDHAVRPQFPKDFMDEVQVVVTVLSVSEKADPVTLSLIAASAALSASNIPWGGPLGSVRVGGKKDEGGNKVSQFTLNPAENGEEAPKLDLDLVLTGTANKISAMEGEFHEVEEDSFLKALKFGHPHIKEIASFIEEFSKEVGHKKYVYESQALPKEIMGDITKFIGEDIKKMITTPMEKLDRVDAYRDIMAKIEAEFEGKYKKTDMKRAFDEIEKKMVRKLILEDKKRPDGRDFETVRPLSMEVGVLPRVHGSALFSRGITQALTITTLGSGSLEQLIQHMYGEETKRYMHHYNALSFSVGEVGPLRGPGRREIGHGMLAEKALRPVIPSREDFPYTIRVVSEILSQNGSSSMAATCGSSLSLMDAGIPIKAPVAGVAIGLMTDEKEENFTVLTDIAGVEDFNGYMDFKLTGTRAGITAVQMDIKLTGLPLTLFEKIVAQSKKARLEILDAMDKVLKDPRSELSKHAPRITQIKIDPSQIGTLIGPGGKTIRKITEESKADIDIEETGLVAVAAITPESMQKALQAIRDLTYIPNVGEIIEGEVMRVEDFGAFVQITPNKDGLVHVSEMAHSFVSDPRSVCKEGDTVKAKVLEVGADGKIKLSMKALLKAQEGDYTPRQDTRPQGGYTPRSGGYQGSRDSRGRDSRGGSRYNPRSSSPSRFGGSRRPQGGSRLTGGQARPTGGQARRGSSRPSSRPAPQRGFGGR